MKKKSNFCMFLDEVNNRLLKKMDYKEAIKYLYKNLPFYQRKGPVAYKNNLDNTLYLDEKYGHPHRTYKSIHVAGTNGKGSVSHMLASVLQQAGYTVGLYTSPHLKDFRERIRVNGVEISKDYVASFVQAFIEKNRWWGIFPSFFELTVAMAFDYFKYKKVDFAVVEVGLGGRLDSTNIIEPEVSVITNISLDHTNLLGSTIEEIAREKGGVIKHGTPVVVGRSSEKSDPVFEEIASGVGVGCLYADKLYSVVENKGKFSVINDCSFVYEDIIPALLGDAQLENLITVVAATNELQKKGVVIQSDDFIEGIKNVVDNTGLKGRWQVLNKYPLTICDTAHNYDGLRFVVQQLARLKYMSLRIVFGVVNDKNLSEILQLLPKKAVYYFTNAKIDRAMPSHLLQEEAHRFGLEGECYSTVFEAYNAAQKEASEEDLIYIGGSTFVVAEVL